MLEKFTIATIRMCLLATLALGTTLCSIGCVDRRFVVTSNAPGASITLDGEPLGPTPLDSSYVYTGKREFRVNAPGYEPLTQCVTFEPKWYDYPGLDLFAEVIWPFRIEDVRRVHFDLQPAQPIAVPEIQAKAENLRIRGGQLPPSSVPDDQPSPLGTRTTVPPNPSLRPTGTTPIPPITPGRFNGR